VRPEVLAAALRCLRRLLPLARIFVAPNQPEGECKAITVDAAEMAAGPLAAAAALERAWAMTVQSHE